MSQAHRIAGIPVWEHEAGTQSGGRSHGVAIEGPNQAEGPASYEQNSASNRQLRHQNQWHQWQQYSAKAMSGEVDR